MSMLSKSFTEKIYDSIKESLLENTSVSDSEGDTIFVDDNIKVNIAVSKEDTTIITDDGKTIILKKEDEIVEPESDVEIEEPIEVPVEEPIEEPVEEPIEEPVEELVIDELVPEETDEILEDADIVLVNKPEERDYQIIDVTELQPTDLGDVRAPDIQDILISVNEAMEEKYGLNWGEIQIHTTRKGIDKKLNEEYSYALAGIKGLDEGKRNHLLGFWVKGNKALKECLITEPDTSEIKHLCSKTKKYTEHFIRVMEELYLSGKPIIDNYSEIKEEVVIPEKPEQVAGDDNGVTYTNDNTSLEMKQKQDKMKDERDKLNKTELDFKEEPEELDITKPVDNTDEIMAEPLKEDETVEPEEEPTESVSDGKAIFHRKPSNVNEMREDESAGITTTKSSYKIIADKELSDEEYEEFSNNLLKDVDWMKPLYDDNSDKVDLHMFSCININNKLLVDSSGYNYARYVAFKGDE